MNNLSCHTHVLVDTEHQYCRNYPISFRLFYFIEDTSYIGLVRSALVTTSIKQ